MDDDRVGVRICIIPVRASFTMQTRYTACKYAKIGVCSSGIWSTPLMINATNASEVIDW